MAPHVMTSYQPLYVHNALQPSLQRHVQARCRGRRPAEEKLTQPPQPAAGAGLLEHRPNREFIAFLIIFMPINMDYFKNITLRYGC
jgi:hypothetical protein